MRQKIKKYIPKYNNKNADNRKSPFDLPRRWVLTLGEANRFSIRFSRIFTTRGLILVSAVIFLIATITAVGIIMLTPLRSLLPGYLGRTERESLIMLEEQVDSMLIECRIREVYMDNLTAIVSDNLPEDSLYTAAQKGLGIIGRDSVSSIPVDSLLPMSESERRLMSELESRDKYVQTILAPMATEGMVFTKPVSAVTGKKEEGPASGLTLTTTGGAGVDAVYRGTVVAAYYDGKDGGTVVIQHPNDFVTSLSGLGTVYAVRGEQVKAGSRLGTLPSRHPELRIRIWHKGVELAPAEVLGY